MTGTPQHSATCSPGSSAASTTASSPKRNTTKQWHSTTLPQHSRRQLDNLTASDVYIATGTRRGQLADLELRHRRRARCEDRTAARKTPACGTSPCRATPRTRSGARSWPWPASSSPGWPCSPSTARPAAGNQTAPAPPVLRRRPARPRRPPPAAPPRRTMALEPAHHHRDQPPPEPSPRLTSRTRPDDQEGQETRAIGTPPTRRDNRETRHDPRLNRPPETARSRSLKPAAHDHERCRLGSRHIFWRGRIIVKNAEPTVLQPACAMRRTVVSPAQRAEIERRCLWI